MVLKNIFIHELEPASESNLNKNKKTCERKFFWLWRKNSVWGVNKIATVQFYKIKINRIIIFKPIFLMQSIKDINKQSKAKHEQWL